MLKGRVTKKNISLVIIVLMLMTLIVFLVGRAFGFFTYEKHGDIVNSITIKGLSINIDNETDDALNITNAYPVYDSEGLENDPFIFTVTNNSSHPISYTLKVENDSDKLAECVAQNTTCPELSTSYIRYSYRVNNGSWSSPSNLGDNDNIIYIDDIQGNEHKQISIKLWIDSAAGNEIQNTYFFGKLILEGSKNTSLAFKQKILNSNTIITDSPTLTAPSSTNNENGLYVSYETNTGDPTYYFRGDVDNNWVSFAGKLWRIVRINEDGTVRLILQDGINDDNFYMFNSSSSSVSNMYYSNSDIVRPTIESWYQTNIVDKGYNEYVSTGDYFCEQAKVTYQASDKVGDMQVHTSYTPNFKCENDVNKKGLYNSNVGLITVDELRYAGGVIPGANTDYYMVKSTNVSFWTMSPEGFRNSQTAIIWNLYKGNLSAYIGGINYDSATNTNLAMAIRPVINLKGDLNVIGTGSESNPYKLDVIEVALDKGNLLYGLDDRGLTTSNRMQYTITDGVVELTATANDGYGFVPGRVYLEAGKTYIFNCETDGTWKADPLVADDGTYDDVEAFLMLNGAYATYFRMARNNNLEFNVTVTGEYWLRLDVNKNGETHNFWNISITEKNPNAKTVVVGGNYGSLPTPTRDGYTFVGWNGKNKYDNDSYSVIEYSSGIPSGEFPDDITITSSSNHNLDFTINVDNKFPAVITDTILLKPNQQYTVSYDREDVTNSPSNYLAYRNYIYSLDANNNYAWLVAPDTSGIYNAYGKVNTSFTTTPSGKIAVAWSKGDQAIYDEVSISNIQIEEGTIATEYEPYIISSSTKVTQTQNHTLTAVWQKNN